MPSETAKRVKGGVPGTEHPRGLWSDYFREVTPDGRAVWEWHGHEHLDPEEDVVCPLDRRSEWTHTNACEVLPDGNILTSFRRLDTVAIVDKASGDSSGSGGEASSDISTTPVFSIAATF